MSSDAGPAGPLLMDLPKPLLQLCIQKCGDTELGAAIATCRQLRDIVTELAIPTCAVQLPPSHGAARQLQAMLNLALSRSKLRLWQHEDDYWEEQDLAGFIQDCRSLRQGQPLHAITTIHLQGLALHEVLPSCLAAACPNLQQLELEACSFLASTPGSLPEPATSSMLTTLKIWDHGEVLRVGNNQQRLLSTAMLRAALQGMPALTSLMLCCHNTWASMPFWDALSAVSKQVVHLDFTAELVGDIQPLRHFSAARTLRLGRRSLYTAQDMGVLIKMRSLQQLSIDGRIDLQVSMVEHACHWMTLDASHAITLSTLACLPLSGIQEVRFSSIYGVEASTQITQAALTNAAKCHSLGGYPSIDVYFHAGEPADFKRPGAHFHGLGILQHMQTQKVVFKEPVAKALVPALNLYLPDFVRSLCFWAGIDDDAVSLLMPALPESIQEIEFGQLACSVGDRTVGRWLDTVCTTTQRHVRVVYWQLQHIAEHAFTCHRRTLLVLPCLRSSKHEAESVEIAGAPQAEDMNLPGVSVLHNDALAIRQSLAKMKIAHD